MALELVAAGCVGPLRSMRFLQGRAATRGKSGHVMNEASQQRLAELRTRYERSLPDKRATVEHAWQAFLAAPDERGALVLQSIAHRLAGSASPYGYDAVGSAAQSLDGMISEWLKRASNERESARSLATDLATPANALIDGLARAIEAARASV
jgi:HPt (histidine-containing phosphotransfer) domain-containing protein